MEPRLKS